MISVVVNSLNERTGLSHYSNSLVEEFNKLKFSFKTINAEKQCTSLKKLINCFGFKSTALNNYPLNLPLKGFVHLTNQQQCIPLNYKNCKAIVTVHDIYPLATGNYTSFFDKKLNNLSMKGLLNAKHFIADSEFTKKELKTHLKISSEKISVVQLGVNAKEFHPLNVKKENTIIFVGSEAPRKNLKVLLEAFEIVKKELKNATLLKIGNSQSAKHRKNTLELINKLNIQNNVFFKNYVTNLNLELNKAGVLVCPSFYEGFGLPVLEGMASGCPVICSKASSLPEIGKDAVEYFNPYDANELAKKIIKVLTNNKLKNKMILKGLKYSSKMTWNQTALKTLEAYKKVL